MKSRPLSILVVLTLIVMSCFLSSPVLSGEHPWDADKPGGNLSGQLPDSTRVAPGGASAMTATSTPNSGGISIFDGLVYRAAYFTAKAYHQLREKGMFLGKSRNSGSR